MAFLAFAAPPASAAMPSGSVVLANACQHMSNVAITDGDFTVSAVGDQFTISDNIQIGPTNGLAGVSWERWDTTGRYNNWRDRSYLTVSCNGDVDFWHARYVLLWHSNTAGQGGVHLILTNTGELRLYNSDWSHIVWRSWSGQRYLAAGTTLPSGGRLASGGAEHRNYTIRTLEMLANGDLVYRVGGNIRWQSGTHVPGARAVLTSHAQLKVLSPSGQVLWSSRPQGSADSALDVEFMQITDLGSGMGRTVWQAPGVS
ncbi:hypothetical protein [Nocardioides baekrokdamisoli]|uniref:hypothetical protein n=1 Tax=Nocardioides baekrokdamisoli TaxID=1804624 RepID=UPI000F768E5E|nr:hypothetical protein [Nocardioides baekrokdamisoli]